MHLYLPRETNREREKVMSLKFAAKSHRYTIDGKSVQGVTTILSKGIPKPALPAWAAKSVAEWIADNPEDLEALRRGGREPMIGFLKGVPWQIRDTAAIRGTDVHALAEKLVHGEEVEVPEHLVGHVEGYAKLIDEFGIEPILTEVSIGHKKEWYAGRLDLVATLWGETWLLDNKTSKGVYGETGLQCAAYAKGEFYVNDDEWDVEIPMPHIDRIGVIHITADGSTIHDLGSIAANFKVFQHVKYLANKTDYIKELVGEAMIP
jgi:hypothetical protein